MLEGHITYFMEIFKFDDIINLDKLQDEYISDITTHLRNLYEYFKEEDYFMCKLLKYAGTIFKRLPETQKLW